MYYPIVAYSLTDSPAFVLFTGGYSLLNVAFTNHDKYNIGSDTTVAATALPAAMGAMAAAGNLNYAAYFGGSTNAADSGKVGTTRLYDYASNAWSVGLALALGPVTGNFFSTRAATCETGAVGVGPEAYVCGGIDVFNFNEATRWIFATETQDASTQFLSVNKNNHAACSSPSKAIISGGLDGAGVAVATTFEYTFLTNALVAGTAITTARQGLTAFGNQTDGWFCAGQDTLGTTLYQLNTQYDYATSAISAGAVIGTDCGANAAASNDETGVLAVAYTGALTTQIRRYDMAGNSWSVATGALTAGRYALAGVCSQPGQLM